jgi:hypothetical protein
MPKALNVIQKYQLSEEQLSEILEQVRKLRKKKKIEKDSERQEEEQLDISVQ